jgi:2-oxoglutarate dehydrogenase E1 component
MDRDSANDILNQTSFLYGGNAAYIEELYARYEEILRRSTQGWQAFFEPR